MAISTRSARLAAGVPCACPCGRPPRADRSTHRRQYPTARCTSDPMTATCTPTFCRYRDDVRPSSPAVIAHLGAPEYGEFPGPAGPPPGLAARGLPRQRARLLGL